MFCAISGNPPQKPVVSTKSGRIFENDLIIEYIQQHGKDPINNESMTVDDLVEINQTQTVTPPRQLNSIPQLLSSLQNEYDSMALEMFSLRKTLEETRKELSTALYHHDAATRVAARLLQERDEARNALLELTSSISGDGVEVSRNGSKDVEVVDAAIPQDIGTAITEANLELFSFHKQQKNKVNVDLGHIFESYDESKNAKPYDSVISFNTSKTNIIMTGKTGKSSLFDIQSNKLIKLETIPSSKDITYIMALGNDDYIVGTKKGEVRFNNVSLNTNHKAPIISILQHPSLSNIIVSIDEAGLLSIINLDQKAVVFNNSVTKDVITADIHLDGALVAIGNSHGEIVIVDLRNGNIATTLKLDTEQSVINLKFGDNGYWLFASYAGNSVEIWDLRKNSSFKVNTHADIQQITIDKSSQLLFCVDKNSKIEFIQYSKSDKSWVLKNELELKKLVSVVVVADSEKNKVELLVLKSNSEVTKVVL